MILEDGFDIQKGTEFCRKFISYKTGEKKVTRVDKWNNRRLAVKYLILILGSFIMIFPFFWMFSTAIKSTPELATFPPALIPQNPVFRNFVDAWMSTPFTRMILNSLLIASITTIIIVFLSTMRRLFKIIRVNGALIQASTKLRKTGF